MEIFGASPAGASTIASPVTGIEIRVGGVALSGVAGVAILGGDPSTTGYTYVRTKVLCCDRFEHAAGNSAVTRNLS